MSFLAVFLLYRCSSTFNSVKEIEQWLIVVPVECSAVPPVGLAISLLLSLSAHLQRRAWWALILSFATTRVVLLWHSFGESVRRESVIVPTATATNSREGGVPSSG